MTSTDRRNKIVLTAVISVVTLTVISLAIAIPVSRSNRVPSDVLDRARDLMTDTPLIDGHNDLAWHLKYQVNNGLENVTNDLSKDLTGKAIAPHSDIPRMKAGKVGAQFWSAYSSCDSQYIDSIHHIIEQIDVIKRMCDKYEAFEFADSSDGIKDAFKRGKIAGLVGIEGGHNIDSSMAVLRALYTLGARYLTLTHSCNTPWADNWLMDTVPKNEREFNGLTEFGKNVVREMNRIGLMIDLSHVSVDVMTQVLHLSESPVIFSHSSAFALCESYRNVNDDILALLRDNKGLVMVGFYSIHINCPPNQLPNTTNKYATLSQVADHIDHIKTVCGEDCVGLGSDFNGADTLPEGLEDVSKFPYLIAELITRGWTDDQVKKLIGENILRVFKEVENTRDRLSSSRLPDESSMSRNSGKEVNNTCRTYVYNPPGEE